MDKELSDIIEKQKQLRAMWESVKDFDDKLKAQIDNYLTGTLGFNKKDDVQTPAEVLVLAIQRAKDGRPRIVT